MSSKTPESNAEELKTKLKDLQREVKQKDKEHLSEVAELRKKLNSMEEKERERELKEEC